MRARGRVKNSVLRREEGFSPERPPDASGKQTRAALAKKRNNADF